MFRPFARRRIPAPATGPRPGLCQTIGTHDLGPNRTCRDCGKPLTDKDLVAATCLLDELPGRRL
jgi:hypothetical protein